MNQQIIHPKQQMNTWDADVMSIPSSLYSDDLEAEDGNMPYQIDSPLSFSLLPPTPSDQPDDYSVGGIDSTRFPFTPADSMLDDYAATEEFISMQLPLPANYPYGYGIDSFGEKHVPMMPPLAKKGGAVEKTKGIQD